jgi:hypothetical protein
VVSAKSNVTGSSLSPESIYAGKDVLHHQTSRNRGPSHLSTEYNPRVCEIIFAEASLPKFHAKAHAIFVPT